MKHILSILPILHLENPGFLWVLSQPVVTLKLQVFPYKTRGQTGKAMLLRAMPAHRILFFIRIVHFNKILGIFDKPASREQRCYEMT